MAFRILGAVATAAMLATVPTSVTADDDDWAGIYKGLDALDGSIDYLSIVPVGDGKFDMRVVSSIISLCEGGKGWIVADGRIIGDDKLVRENVVVHCVGAEPKSVSNSVYTRDDETEILTLEAPDDKRKLYYHRLSNDD